MTYFRSPPSTSASAAALSVLLWLAMLSEVQVTDYIRSNSDLTSVPTDIPLDVIRVDLSKNLITNFDSIDGNWSNIEELDVSYNKLAEFPNLANCSGVQWLNLVRNRITNILPDQLDILTRLVSLDIRMNKLTAIPDVSGPSLTLAYLDISNNRFTSIPKLPKLGKSIEIFLIYDSAIFQITDESWVGFSVLRKVSLAGTRLTVFPGLGPREPEITHLFVTFNSISQVPYDSLRRMVKLEFLDLKHNLVHVLPSYICHVAGPPLVLQLEGNPLECDCDLAWLKMAEESCKVILTPPVTCAGPASLAGTRWTDITWSHLQCTDSRDLARVTTRRAGVLPADYVCDVMHVVRILSAPTAGKCAVLCLAERDCVMFGYGSTAGDPQSCALTAPGVSPDRDLFHKWYIMY